MRETVRVRRRRLRFIKFLLFLIIIYIIGYGLYFLFTMPIKNIFVSYNNNDYYYPLNDQLILEQAKINNYPSFLLTTGRSIRNRLLNNEYIKEVTVAKKWFGKVFITITNHQKLFYDKQNNIIVLENKEVVTNDNRVNHIPIVINYIPDTIYDYFVDKMAAVDIDIKIKISSIQYKPNDVDKERFLLSMNDGNHVYLTLYKFEKINEYNNILPSVENKKGILYLDSGNYFQILE